VRPILAAEGHLILAVNRAPRGVGGIAKPLGLFERISRVHQYLHPVGRGIGPFGTVRPRISDARLSAVVHRRLVPFDHVRFCPFGGPGRLLRPGRAKQRRAQQRDAYSRHCGCDPKSPHWSPLTQAMTSIIGRAVFIEPEPNSPTGAPTSCCAVRETRVTDSPVARTCCPALCRPPALPARNMGMFSMEWILAYPVSLNAMIRLLSSRVPAPSLTESNSTRKSPKACITMPASILVSGW